MFKISENAQILKIFLISLIFQISLVSPKPPDFCHLPDILNAQNIPNIARIHNSYLTPIQRTFILIFIFYNVKVTIKYINYPSCNVSAVVGDGDPGPHVALAAVLPHPTR